MRVRNIVGAAMLAFAPLIGASAQSGSTTVLGTANPWQALGNGVLDGTLPTFIGVTGTGSATFSASGATNCCSGAPTTPPDGFVGGSNTTAFNKIAGISGSNSFFLVGLFLANALPGSAPPDRAYVASDYSLSSFSNIQLGQVFFIGDGWTGSSAGSGTQQTFNIPTGATGLYLGIQDAFGFNGAPLFFADNTGSWNINYSIGSATTTVPEPATMTLMATGLVGMMGAARRKKR